MSMEEGLNKLQYTHVTYPYYAALKRIQSYMNYVGNFPEYNVELKKTKANCKVTQQNAWVFHLFLKINWWEMARRRT